MVTLNINGKVHEVDVEPETPLLLGGVEVGTAQEPGRRQVDEAALSRQRSELAGKVERSVDLGNL